MKPFVALLAAALVTPATAADQAYPVRPIRLILTNATGSASDILGRIVFLKMGESLGHQIVVDNRAGAGGTMGVAIGTQAAPDGYTLFSVTIAPMAIAPHVYRKLAYHPLKDAQPVGLFVKSEIVLAVHAAVPARSAQDLIELARAQPGKLNMASAGIGATSHLGGLMFTSLAGIQATHVPYKGGGPSMQSVAQGESQFTLGPYTASFAHVKAGRMRALATGGSKRFPLTPELPTLQEAGVKGYEFYGWNGVMAPVGTPKAIVERLNAAMTRATAQDEVRQLFAAQGEVPASAGIAEFGAIVRTDYERMAKLVRLAGIQPE